MKWTHKYEMKYHAVQIFNCVGILRYRYLETTISTISSAQSIVLEISDESDTIENKTTLFT